MPEQVGWSLEAKLLSKVLKQLIKLTKVVAAGNTYTTTTTTTSP